jgi:Arc/MetJ-type ribon-helix-helix transcriptional regulator
MSMRCMVNLSLPPGLAAQLREAVGDEYLSVSDLMRDALRVFLDKRNALATGRANANAQRILAESQATAGT